MKAGASGGEEENALSLSPFLPSFLPPQRIKDLHFLFALVRPSPTWLPHHYFADPMSDMGEVCVLYLQFMWRMKREENIALTSPGNGHK